MWLDIGGGVDGIICSEVGVFAGTGVGSDEKEDRGSLQRGGQRRRVVSFSSSINSSTSQRFFAALHVPFAGNESGSDGDSCGCSGCGGPGSKGCAEEILCCRWQVFSGGLFVSLVMMVAVPAVGRDGSSG
jgi:hypothetical protein